MNNKVIIVLMGVNVYLFMFVFPLMAEYPPPRGVPAVPDGKVIPNNANSGFSPNGDSEPDVISLPSLKGRVMPAPEALPDIKMEEKRPPELGANNSNLASPRPASSPVYDGLSMAVASLKKVNSLLVVGRVWSELRPDGGIDVKAALLYRGKIIAVINIDPITGNILPIGMAPIYSGNNINIRVIRQKLLSDIKRIRILPVAEFIPPERCWSFPVVLDNIVIAHIKFYYDGVHIIEQDV